MNNDELYVVFESCWEMINRLNTDKKLKLGKLAQIHQTIKLYTMIVKSHDDLVAKEPINPLDLVDWTFKP